MKDLKLEISTLQLLKLTLKASKTAKFGRTLHRSSETIAQMAAKFALFVVELFKNRFVLKRKNIIAKIRAISELQTPYPNFAAIEITFRLLLGKHPADMQAKIISNI